MMEHTLTIPNGQTESNEVEIHRSADAVTLYAPATLPETVVLHTSFDGVTFRAHQEDGADIALTADKAMTVYPLKVHSIKLVAGSAVAAERVVTAYAAGV